MFQHVKHGDGGATGRGGKGRRESVAQTAGTPARLQATLAASKRKIEAGYVFALPRSDSICRNKPASAADVQNHAFLFRIAQRPLDEMQVIAHHESAIPLLQPVGRRSFGNEPIVGRVVVAQLDGRGLRRQADQAALAALDDLEDLGGGAVQAVRGGKQNAGLGGVAGGARFAGWRERVRGTV